MHSDSEAPALVSEGALRKDFAEPGAEPGEPERRQAIDEDQQDLDQSFPHRRLSTARPVWDPLDDAAEQIRVAMPSTVLLTGRPERCLWNTATELQPAWRLRGTVLDQSYEWIASGSQIFDRIKSAPSHVEYL